MLFRGLPVAETVYARGHLPGSAGAFPTDAITLGWEDRTKTRARRCTDGGVEFATALRRGTVLRDGDGLVLQSLPLVVFIRERPESVLVARPSNAAEWALWAYHIGNSHQPVMITLDALVCPEIAGAEQMFDHHAIPFVREQMPFTPVTQDQGHAAER
jgi:urease accessory protein